jgi:hypothetical protein
MAWIVKFEPKAGQFFLYGDYGDLKQRLETYRSTEMPAEERALFKYEVTYRRWVFEKFTKEIGVAHPMGPVALTPIKDREWPSAYQAERPIKSLGALISLADDALVVDERLRDLIQGLEPGIHQSRPITIQQPSFEPVPGSYFILVIGRFLHSFLPEATEQQLWHEVQIEMEGKRVNSGSYSCRAFGAEAFAKLAFSREVIGAAHLWRERRIIGSNFYISDTLRDAITQAKLPMPPHFRVKEV